MGRPLRIEYKGALYHITSRGNEGNPIFRGESDRRKFLDILGDYHDRYGIIIHAYVLMDNHYHLIFETPRGNLLKVMHGINSGYTGYFNRKYARKGHLFQGRYRGILVDKDAYLVPLSRYIHLNPVRAGLVQRAEQYAWSSYRGYVGLTKEISWVEYAWVLSQFGRERIGAGKKYRQYVGEQAQRQDEHPLKRLHGQIILGGGEFVDRLKGMLKGRSMSREIVERRRFQEEPHLEDLIKKVANAFGVKEEEILGRGSKGNVARKVALYMAQRFTGRGNEQVGRYFGGIEYSAVSKASARLREEMSRDRGLRKRVTEIESHFKA